MKNIRVSSPVRVMVSFFTEKLRVSTDNLRVSTKKLRVPMERNLSVKEQHQFTPEKFDFHGLLTLRLYGESEVSCFYTQPLWADVQLTGH